MECCSILPDFGPKCHSGVEWCTWKGKRIKMYADGDCYDELGNYLGKGKLEGEILQLRSSINKKPHRSGA